MSDEGRKQVEDFLRNPEFIRRTRAVSETNLDHLYAETDRGCALVGAAMLDESLRSLLECYFVDDPATAQAFLVGGNSPLGSFSSRITAAAT